MTMSTGRRRETDAVNADHEELLERYEVMRSELERLRVRASSPDLSVTVESGPGGGVVSVTLSADALRQSPEALSASITATIRAASGKAAQATRRVASSITDADAPALVASGRLPGGSGAGEVAATPDPADAEPEDEGALRRSDRHAAGAQFAGAPGAYGEAGSDEVLHRG
jgi:DNA-binding protein YbaB